MEFIPHPVQGATPIRLGAASGPPSLRHGFGRSCVPGYNDAEMCSANSSHVYDIIQRVYCNKDFIFFGRNILATSLLVTH